MRKVLISTLLVLLSTSVFAALEIEKVQAELKFAQTEVEKDESNLYKQQAPVTENGITYEVHVYESPKGTGYIKRASKIVDANEFILEDHSGEEIDRIITDSWTQVKSETKINIEVPANKIVSHPCEYPAPGTIDTFANTDK